MKSIADFEPMVIAASELAEDIHPTILQELIRDAIVDFMRSSGVAQDSIISTPSVALMTIY